MSHGDSISRLPEGFRATAQTDSTPFAGLVDAVAQPVRHPVPPEVVHTPRGRDVLRNFVVDIAGVSPTWTAGNFIETTVADIRERVDAHARGDRVGRPGHLRAVGRRRLGGRGGARPSRGRRPADLHLRRPRADAQEGIGAAAGHLRARPRDAPGHGRCARALPRPAGRRRGPRAEAQDHRRRVHPRLRGGGGQARPDRLPDPGHALPGRHRIGDVRDEGRPEDQDPPQRRRPAGRPALPAHRAAALPVQGRGPAVGLELGLPEAMVLRQPFPGRASRSGSSARSPPSGSTRCAKPTGSSSTRSRRPASTAACGSRSPS